MRFLADMGISPRTVAFLRKLGYEAVHLHEEGLDRLEDLAILAKARKEGFILLTHDLDFGELIAASGARLPSEEIDVTGQRPNPRLYFPELRYCQEKKGFPFRQAVLITATTVSRWCTHFYARVIAPKTKASTPLEKSGLLPEDISRREAFVADVVNWLLDNSAIDELFCLLLDHEATPQPGKVAKFDHHDDTCCWVLNLTPTEFAYLQATWKAKGLPEDLFYPEQEGLCILYTGTGWKAKLLRALGVRRYYTPKQWKQERSGGAA